MLYFAGGGGSLGGWGVGGGGMEWCKCGGDGRHSLSGPIINLCPMRNKVTGVKFKTVM